MTMADWSTSPSFESLVVLELSRELPKDSLDWLLDKLTARRSEGGAELQIDVRLSSDGSKSNKLPIFHIGASMDRLLDAAELMQLKKTFSDGIPREISLTDIDSFQNSSNLDSFLTSAEKQKIILHEIESIRYQDSDSKSRDAAAAVSDFHKDEVIFAKCKSKGVFNYYPLHDHEDLQRFRGSWYGTLIRQQPIEEIQRYFGETIATYFAYLGWYTTFLFPPAVLGLVCQWNGADLDLIPFFCVFNLVWTTIFLETWKRKCATLAFQWGTVNVDKFEEPRAEFHGEEGKLLERNKVTGRLEPKYSQRKRLIQFYCVSVPVLSICLVVSILAMLSYFYTRESTLSFYHENKTIFTWLLSRLPTIVYGLVIYLLDIVYRKIAIFLNDWENHRLQSTYDNNLIAKLVVFNFVNYFMSLFYVAFILQDFSLLRENLATLLITWQLIQQFQECLIPYLIYKHRTKQNTLAGEDRLGGAVEKKKYREGKEMFREQYPGTLDDYLEIFLQFGYAFLFSAVFPTAAFWALLNNLTEIRTDAFKLCRVYRRPFVQPTDGIGAWQTAFELMSIVSVMTNCALVALSPQVKEYMASYYSDVTVVLIFVAAEHVIIFIKKAIDYLVPDVPYWINTKLASDEYIAKLAWIQKRTDDVKRLPKLKQMMSVPGYSRTDPNKTD